MYHLLPIRRILTGVAFLNAFVLAYVAYALNPATNSSLEPLRYLSISIFIIDIVVLLITAVLWRWIWKIAPMLADIYFPDINGIWEGKIIFDKNYSQIGLHAKVRIRQNLWSTHVDLSSETSKSSTLVAYPTSEAGNKLLYYVYRNTPRRPEHPEYKGTSILEVKIDKNSAKLHGHYFTIRGTQGTIELTRISDDPNDSYELY